MKKLRTSLEDTYTAIIEKKGKHMILINRQTKKVWCYDKNCLYKKSNDSKILILLEKSMDMKNKFLNICKNK